MSEGARSHSLSLFFLISISFSLELGCIVKKKTTKKNYYYYDDFFFVIIVVFN